MTISTRSAKVLVSLALWVGIGSAQEIISLREDAGDTAFNQALIAGVKGANSSMGKPVPRVAVDIGDTIIPHVVDGGGWRTSFSFVNLENYPVRFKLLPEAPAPERIALLSGAQQIFGSIRDQQLYRIDRMPAGFASQAFSFSPPAAARL